VREHSSRLWYNTETTVKLITVHLTFGTYGTRLHGGSAPTVMRSQNQVGEPFVDGDPDLYEASRERMRESPCYFDKKQRLFVETEVPLLCERGGWTYHLACCQPDHVHVLLSVAPDPKTVRKWLKTWLSRSLNKQFQRRTWFAEGGSGKWIFDDARYQNVYQYILKQRAHEEVVLQ